MAVTAGGHAGRFLGPGAKTGSGTLVWTDGERLFQLAGLNAGDDPTQLIALADSLVQVAPNDPRIVAPANCRVPAGSVCPDPGAGA